MLSHIKIFFLCVFVAMNGACSKSPTLTSIGPNEKILAFGDSITSGEGAGENESYPAQLQRLIGRRVINAGVSGELAETGVRRLPQALLEHQPSLLLLCHGGNNFLQQQDENYVKNQIRAMIETAHAAKVQVVLIGVPRLGLVLRDTKIYRDLAEEFLIPYEKDVLSKILSNPSLKADQIHPNQEGCRILAESLGALLVKSGAIQNINTILQHS